LKVDDLAEQSGASFTLRLRRSYARDRADDNGTIDADSVQAQAEAQRKPRAGET
jgi:hypothetical protein